MAETLTSTTPAPSAPATTNATPIPTPASTTPASATPMSPAPAATPATPATPATTPPRRLRDLLAHLRGTPDLALAEPEPDNTDSPEDTTPAVPAPGSAPGSADAAPAPAPDGTEPEAEPAPAPERVALPSRNAAEPEVEIEVSDPVVADRLRQLKNGYLRGEAVREQQAAVRRAEAELADVRDAMAYDPVGYIRSALAPEYHGVLALQLLRDPAVRQAVQGHVEALLDPERLPLVEAQLKALEYETRERTQQEATLRREAVAHAARIQEALAEVLQDDRLTQDCLADVARQVRQGAPATDAAQLALLVAPRLREAGLDLFAVQDALHQRLGRAARAPADGAAPALRAVPRPAATARRVAATPAPTGADFVAGQARRTAAAAAAPPGSVAPAAGGPPVPADAKLTDALKLLKERTRRG